MISDITIGQYYSGTSVIHRMDARMQHKAACHSHALYRRYQCFL